MKIGLKIAIMLSLFSLMIGAFGYISLIELDKAAEPITIDNQKLLASSKQTILIFVSIFMIIAICLGVLIGRSIVNPMRNLQNLANKIAGGEAEFKIDSIRNDDEVHDLAISFKSTVNSLRKSQKLYSRSEKKYRDLYENSPALYRTIDTDGIIISCNKSYAERLGYSKDEIIGASIFKHVADNNIEAMRKSFETWKSTGAVKDREIWLKTKDGTVFPTLISANNLYDENGGLIGSNTIIKDISAVYEAKKRIEKEALMELQFAELKKLDKLKGEFASMITHELKSPLTPIMGRCDMLKQPGLLGNLNALQLDSVNKIHKNARRLERLIRDVLEAQKLEMGRIKFNKNKIDVTEFMTEIHRDYLPLMKEKQIDSINSTEEKLILISDENRIRQVIDNLVLNSADFTPAKQGKIEIGARSEDSKIVFYVKDNGAGIPKETQPIMFKKFYQADTSLTRKHAGTGLGLVVSKGIIEGLGGKIWFESQPGTGTSFFFTIPKEQ